MIIDSFVEYLEQSPALLTLLGDKAIVFGVVQSESLGKNAPFIEINQVQDSADQYSTGSTYMRMCRVPVRVVGANPKQAVTVWKALAEEVEGQPFLTYDSRARRVRLQDYSITGFDSIRGEVFGTVEIWYQAEIKFSE
ncbi:MAG TPA: hypothetical protein PKD85_22480 [Saprospiraceae bacterium]|nr:hypothetical protein [Saprospiraceae bacterium]